MATLLAAEAGQHHRDKGYYNALLNCRCVVVVVVVVVVFVGQGIVSGGCVTDSSLCLSVAADLDLKG